MTLLFPIHKFSRTAYNNKIITYSVFILYIISYSIYKRDTIDPYNIFELFEHLSLPIHTYLFKLIYVPLGHPVNSLIVTTIFLYTLYNLSNLKPTILFVDFSIPFINLSFVIILVRIIRMFLIYIEIDYTFLDFLCSIYSIICFVLILNEEFRVSMIRSVFSSATALLLLFLCGFVVFPGLGILIEKLGL